MRNRRDTELLTSPRFQQKAAAAILAAMAAFVRTR
jgi:N-acetylmuramoyl-L-alanine amidase